MQNSLSAKIEIKCTGQGSLNLTSIAQSPRTSSPADVKTACDNVIITQAAEIPDAVVAMTKYIMTEFFSLAHRTGLYNRQLNMWKSIASCTEVELNRLEQGFFNKVTLPNYDLIFKDARGCARLMAHLAEPFADFNINGNAEDKRNTGILKSLIYRVQKQQAQRSSLSGIFLCLPRPFPENVLSLIAHWTNASDPVGRYESILPRLGISINLLEMNWSTQQLNPYEISLVHPKIQVRDT